MGFKEGEDSIGLLSSANRERTTISQEKKRVGEADGVKMAQHLRVTVKIENAQLPGSF
jgi:hypothetical protein